MGSMNEQKKLNRRNARSASKLQRQMEETDAAFERMRKSMAEMGDAIEAREQKRRTVRGLFYIIGAVVAGLAIAYSVYFLFS